MKTLYKTLFVFILLLVIKETSLFANHLTGGEMRYEYVSTMPNGRQIYRITVHIYRDGLSGGAEFDNPLYMTVFNMDNMSSRNKRIVLRDSDIMSLPINDLGPCARNVPDVWIQKSTYTILDTVTLNNNGYVYAHQRCCRSDAISNLFLPGDQGSTYSVHLTRAAMLLNNSSPVFIREAPVLVCVRSNFEYQFAATDPNGHRLRYYLCEPNLGGNNTNSGIRPVTASRPPYTSVRYANGHSATRPFGQNVDVQLDPNTGLLIMQPDRVGIFTIAVCVEEFDGNNNSIGFTKRDIQFNIADCVVASAVASIDAPQPLDGVFSTCKGQTIQFKNRSLDAQTYFWDFGVEGIDSDTSRLREPIFSYPDSGRYDVTLIINKGQTCADTTKISLRVYPVLTPDFDYQFLCEGSPVEFSSTSTSTVDPIVKETWTYNNQVLSEERNFEYTFPARGPYPVRLTVETQNGCVDTISKNILLPDFVDAQFSIAGIRQGQSDTFVVCNNNREVVLTNLSPATSARLWRIGNTTNTDLSPVHVFSDTGTYRIQLIINPNTNCADTSTKWVRVLPVPEADFTFVTSCLQFPVEFSSIRSRPFDQIGRVSWNFGDGTTSTEFNPLKEYAASRNYNVRLNITTDAGCTATITKPVTVHPDPVAEFEIIGEHHNQQYILCDGLLPIVFDPKAINAQSYAWDFGPGLGSTNAFTAMFVFPDTGTYDVQLIINKGQRCTDTITKPIRLIDGISRINFVSRDVCVNTAQTFTNQSVAVKNDLTTYLWDFGDNTTSNVRSPNKTYTQPGTYTVKLIIGTALGCKDSLVKTVTVFPASAVDFVNDDACLNLIKKFTNTSSITSGTIDKYAWTFGNLGNSADQHPEFVFSAPGNVNVTLIVTSDQGCVSRVTKPVRVRQASTADFEYTNHCVKAPVYFKDISTSPYNDIVQWIWTLEPGQTRSGKDVQYTYSKPGKHTVKLVVVTASGCRDSIIKDINIQDVPVARFNISGNPANNVTLFSCNADYSVTFNNTSPTQLNYLWSFGIPGATSTDEDPLFVFPDTGTYIVRLTTESGTVCQDFEEKSVRILPPVTAAFSFTTECVKAPVYFVADTERPFDPIQTIAWNFGDGTSSNEKDPEKLYATPGARNVRLTLTAASGCRATITQRVTIAPAPVANFVPQGVTDANGSFLKCEELLGVYFRNTSTGNQTNYWEFTDLNRTSSDISPTNVFSKTDSFPITLYINRGQICSDSITKQVEVIHGIESVDFEFENACVNTDIQFTDRSKAVLNNFSEYLWNFGDNTTSAEKNPKKQYSGPGEYTVKLYVKTLNGCIDSLERKITIYPAPQSVFDVTKACLNELVRIENHSTISSGRIDNYFWTFGNQSTSSAISPDVTYTVPGFYPVSLTSTSDFGCQHTLNDVIEIRIPSIPDFNYVNQCVSAPVEFKDLTVSAYDDIVKWEWEVLPNIILNGKDPIYNFPSAGDYDVKYVVTTSLGCRDSVTKTISIKPHPVADFVVDGIELGTGVFVKCDDSRSVSFINESTDNLTNLWRFDAYGNSTDASPVFIFPDTGSYNIRLTINDGTLCRDTKQLNIQVLPGLYVDYDYTLACERNEIEFTDRSTTVLNDIVSRNWSTGDGQSYTGRNISHTYEKFGKYQVEFIVQTARGCLDTLTKEVTVFALPKVDVELPEVCPAKRTRLPNASGAVNNNAIKSYYWNFGNGITSTDRLPFVTYEKPGTYDVLLKVITAAGCEDSIKDVLLVRDFIEPVIVQSQTLFCEQEYIIFDASESKGIFQNFHWAFGDGQSSELARDSVRYNDGGEYTVTLTLNDELCGDFRVSSTIDIISIPVIHLGEDFALCPNLTTTLHIGNQNQLDSIKWNTGETNTPQIIVDGNAGTVSVEIFHKGCYNIDSVYIMPSCDVLAPKVFSPNGDGNNDYFNLLPPNVLTYRLFVYNRWGHEIFSTDNLNKGWDGKYKGEDLPMDNYTYYAVGVKTDGSNFTIQGGVLLIR